MSGHPTWVWVPGGRARIFERSLHPEVAGSKLFGPRRSDRKGFVGTALAMEPRIGQARLKSTSFRAVYDEEVAAPA